MQKLERVSNLREKENRVHHRFLLDKGISKEKRDLDLKFLDREISAQEYKTLVNELKERASLFEDDYSVNFQTGCI